MTRKGNKKVRTGCLTCKARKVKCDEAKPWCNRCSSTGRTCEGYSYNPDYSEGDPEQAITQQLPLRISSTPLGASSESENRSLQYYYEIAAPFLAGSAGSYFWTTLVMQFSDSHTAVRHSVIAISSLYRQIQESPVPPGNAAIWDSQLTLHHYNAAIRELKSTPTPHKQPLVLLVCVLFICIEFMQSNREAAIQHCKHGMLILENCKPEYSWASDYLLPVFRRMSAFPFFFGHGPADYPDLNVLMKTAWEPFHTLGDARDMMDEIFSRTLSLMRWGDEYRMGAFRNQPVPKHMLDENVNVESMLDVWKRFYDALDSRFDRSPSADTTSTLSLGDPQNLAESYNLLARYEACQILLSMALNFNEMAYDEHHSRWLRICELLHNLAAARQDLQAGGPAAPKFVFDMGAMPIVTFVLIKCRYYEIRRNVWNLIPFVGSPQESLWERSFIMAITRRVIELEHGTAFDESGEPTQPALWEITPQEQRMEHVWGDPKPTLRVIYGKEIRGRAVGFFYKKKNGDLRMTTEFLEEPAGPGED